MSVSAPRGNVLTHQRSTFVNFREIGADFRWIDAQQYTLRAAAIDQELLAALVTDVRYDYSYAEPRSERPKPGAGIHGPYRLEAISSESFKPVSRADAVRRLEAWYHGVPEHFAMTVTRLIDELLPRDWALYELPDTRSENSHEWGNVIGVDGFHEFVAISPDRTCINLVVAGDD
ncbi:hypothetical protein ACWGJP_11280 [Microbacterium sp. NPDC055903]